MTAFFSAYQDLFLWLSFLSLVFFLGSLAAVPWLVGRLPRDYFLDPGKKSGRNPIRFVLRNGIGLVVFLMGIIMLFVPGQGILTMVAALVIMEFPGKSHLIRTMVGFEKVRSGLNWLRRKKGRAPLRFPDSLET